MLQLPQQLDLPEKVRRGLKRQWDTLQDTVQQLRPIERFRVVGVAFRRYTSLKSLTSTERTVHMRAICTRVGSMMSPVDPYKSHLHKSACGMLSK